MRTVINSQPDSISVFYCGDCKKRTGFPTAMILSYDHKEYKTYCVICSGNYCDQRLKFPHPYLVESHIESGKLFEENK